MTAVIINPNSTEAMTAAMLVAARQAAPHLAIEGWTSHAGPAAIEGPKDGDAAAGPLLDLITKATDDGATGIIIGCFDDTALTEASRRAPCPVIGIGQAAFHHCALRHRRFSVVTTLAVSVPVIEANIARYGFSALLGRVRASGVPVLDLDRAPEAAVSAIIDEARQALREDNVGAVVLGCAGMVHVTAAARDALDVPVVDPVTAAVGCLGWLSRT